MKGRPRSGLQYLVLAILAVVGIVDVLVLNAFKPVVRFWRAISGRDNFSLAILMVWVAALLFDAEVAFQVVHTHSIATQLSDPVWALTWTWFMSMHAKRLREIRKLVESAISNLGALPAAFVPLMRRVRHDRIWSTTIGVFCCGWNLMIIRDTLPWGSALLAQGFAMYIASNFTLPGQSVFSKAKNKVKAAALRAAKWRPVLPSPAPSPA